MGWRKKLFVTVTLGNLQNMQKKKKKNNAIIKPRPSSNDKWMGWMYESINLDWSITTEYTKEIDIKKIGQTTT